MHLEKNLTYACIFPVQRKEINVVKVRFTMRYSSGKLSNDKVITTACIFWRPIACSFQVEWKHFIFRQQNIWNPAIFSNPVRGSGQKSSRMLITFFRPEALSKEIPCQSLEGLRVKIPVSLSWYAYEQQDTHHKRHVVLCKLELVVTRRLHDLFKSQKPVLKPVGFHWD